MAFHNYDYENPIDITLALNEKTILYPGDRPMELSRILGISIGDSLNMSEIKSFNLHMGTHVDLPSHFLDNGLSMENYAITSFIGEAEVFEIMDVDKIEKEHIQELNLKNGGHIILKTRNCKLLKEAAFNHDYCFLTKAASEELLKHSPKSIGFDYYSLDPSNSTTFESHKVFAQANISVFVCLDLHHVDPGQYLFSGTPLALTGVEASPVRAVLFNKVNA